MLIVPPEQVPHDEHPEHVAPAEEQPPAVYLPLHVCVEPLYEHVPLSMLHERSQVWVDDVFDTAVQFVLQLHPSSFVFCVYPVEHVAFHAPYDQSPQLAVPVHADEDVEPASLVVR